MFNYDKTISFRVPSKDYEKVRLLALKRANKRKKVSIGDYVRDILFEKLDKVK
jgi:hypothetical protein